MQKSSTADFRYKILDQCFRQHHRYWKIEELVRVVSEQLKTQFGGIQGISQRTIEGDIYTMRQDPPMGFQAPIAVKKRHGYYYHEPGFCIEKKPLNAGEYKAIREAIALLRQFRGLPHYGELERILLKLEGGMHRNQTGWDAIQFESNEQVAGTHWMERLYNAIGQRQPLLVWYTPFQAEEKQTFTFHPYLLKEYRNRWFVFGHQEAADMIYCLALDRITGIQFAEDKIFYRNPEFHPVEWFRDIIGVTRFQHETVTEIVFSTSPRLGHYIHTKPLHPSQCTLDNNASGWRFSLQVIPNFELRSELLRFGKNIRIEQPSGFKLDDPEF